LQFFPADKNKNDELADARCFVKSATFENLIMLKNPENLSLPFQAVTVYYEIADFPMNRAHKRTMRNPERMPWASRK